MNSRPRVPKQPPLSPVHFDWWLLRTETMENRECLEWLQRTLWTCKCFSREREYFNMSGRAFEVHFDRACHVWDLTLSIPALNALGGFYRWCLISVFTESGFCHDVRNFKLMLCLWSVEYNFWYQHWSVLSFHQKESEKDSRLTFGPNSLFLFFKWVNNNNKKKSNTFSSRRYFCTINQRSLTGLF